MSKPTLVEFDLDRYLRNSKKVDLSGIDWSEVPNHPLSNGDVMCLHYMMDIEAHTVIYLRDLLATRVAADPQITAFLSCWVYEELWHGEAFSDFLRVYGLEIPAEPKQIVIQLAGIHDPQAAAKIIGQTAQLELYDLEADVTGPSRDTNGSRMDRT